MLKGPAHVAKLPIRKLQDERSKLGKPYRVNAEQLGVYHNTDENKVTMMVVSNQEEILYKQEDLVGESLAGTTVKDDHGTSRTSLKQLIFASAKTAATGAKSSLPSA